MISSKTKRSRSLPTYLWNRFGLTAATQASAGTRAYQRSTFFQSRILIKGLSASLLVFCIAGPSCIPTVLDHHEEQVLDSIPEYPNLVMDESIELYNQSDVEQHVFDNADLSVEVISDVGHVVYEGELVTFSAQPSINDDTLLYSWSQTSGTPAQIGVSNQPTVTFVVPKPISDTDILSFRVTIEWPEHSNSYKMLSDASMKRMAIGTISISIINLNYFKQNVRFSLLDPITGNPISSGVAPAFVRFTVYTIDGTPLPANSQYSWAVKDAYGIIDNCGSLDTHAYCDHIFASAGEYNVTLTLLLDSSQISLINKESGDIHAVFRAQDALIAPGAAIGGGVMVGGNDESNEWYVDSVNGSNDNHGTGWHDAWLTLKHMSNQIHNDMNPGGCIRSGDTVYIKGTFLEGLRPSLQNPGNANITFIGIDSPLIYSQGITWALDLTNRNGYTYKNITFQTSGPELPKEDREHSLAVVFIRGGCYNIFRNCTFKNAGLVGENYSGTRAVVELIWNSNYNEFYDCTAIAEEFTGETPSEFGVFGRRVWGVIGSSYNYFNGCTSYGSSVVISAEGQGVDFTIYGSHQEVSEGIFESRPCIGNLIVKHTSHNANLYGLGITAGDSYCQDNWFKDCVVYATPNALSGGYMNASSDRGQPLKCFNNGWDNCIVYGGEVAGKQQAGFQVKGMANVIARDCIVYGLTGTTQCGFLLYTVGSSSASGSFTVINPVATGVDTLTCSYGDTPCIVSE